MKVQKLVLIILIANFLFACSQRAEENIGKDAVFTVSYPYGYIENTENIYLSISDLKKNYGLSDFSSVQLLSLNNHNTVSFKLYDTNSDKKADLLGFELQINPKEPIRPFEFKSTEESVMHKISTIDSYANKLKITYLHSASECKADTVVWSEKIAKTFMDLYPHACDLEAFSPHKWTYTNGFFTNALCELYDRTGNSDYLNYAQKWIDCFVAPDGSIEKYVQEKYRLDDILPARTLLWLHDAELGEQYKIAADNFIHHIENQPKNSDGGYWHKKIYAHQMWLDGIYMGDVYTAQYAKMFAQAQLFDEAVKQIKLIYHHTVDAETGLMYHGYDENRNDVWADPESGTSPEFWGRGMGWYMMALVDVLEYLPKNHPERNDVIEILHKTSEALLKVQDTNSALWFQVLDKGHLNDNWIETSASAMFAYAFAKGANYGFLSPDYLQKAENVFNSLLNNYVFFDSEQRFYLTETVHVGTLNFKSSDGSYNYYINVDRRINDFKGVAAFLYLAMALNK